MNSQIEMLLTKQMERLAASIEKPLTEVVRWFVLTPEKFLENHRFKPADFMTFNSGMTSFHFGHKVVHSLDVYGEQLSLVLLPEPARGDEFEKPYYLSKYIPVRPDIKAFLGKICKDIRIWIYKEAIQYGEAGEAGISYVFNDNTELFYSIYLHGELDSDYLTDYSYIQKENVEKYYSFKARSFLRI